MNVYRLNFWKRVTHEGHELRVATDREDATEVEVVVGRILFRPKRFKLPEERGQLEQFERYLLEAYNCGVSAGRAAIRQAIMEP